MQYKEEHDISLLRSIYSKLYDDAGSNQKFVKEPFISDLRNLILSEKNTENKTILQQIEAKLPQAESAIIEFLGDL